MALFVEASGYSKDDVDAAYDRGVADGGSSVLKGTATQAQVLEGYTFSSAAVGSNKSGTISNRGTVNATLNPGGEYLQRYPGYYTGIQVSAKPNTQTRVLQSVNEDLGLQNLVRYVDASNIYNSGLSDWFNNSAASNTYKNSLGNVTSSSSYSFSGMSKNFTKDTILILTVATTKTSNLSTYPEPSYVWNSGSPNPNNFLVLNFRNKDAGASAQVEESVWIFKIPAGTVLRCTTLNFQAACRAEYSVTEIAL